MFVCVCVRFCISMFLWAFLSDHFLLAFCRGCPLAQNCYDPKIPKKPKIEMFERFCALEISRKERLLPGIKREIRNLSKIIRSEQFSLQVTLLC